ncbi:MAG: class I SAM-dependent methyltransferase [Clostridia bacterium]|nr:MAG: class I SAM-dependent methyltransferase [Clostridia bacterium]
MDWLFPASLRRRVIAQAMGKVLEVGVGTGANLPHYPPGGEVVAIDFSPAMLAKAREKASGARVPVQLLEMDVQNMSFPDASFDTVVATCVFCSVPDPVKGLKEVRRVCRPGGRVILLEHVRSENPVAGAIMDVINPVCASLIGDNINRRTVANVQAAGLRLIEVQDVFARIVKLIVAAPQ